MAKVFLLFGISGSGKTTVLTKVRNARTVSVGTEILNAYSTKFKGMDRDTIKFKELETYGLLSRVRSGVFGKLVKRTGTLMLDTHACLKAGDGYVQGLSLRDCEILRGRCRAIVYIDAKTKDILTRRKRDSSRRRASLSADELDRLRDINVSLSMAYALQLQVPVYIVQNDYIKDAARKIEEIIERS